MKSLILGLGLGLFGLGLVGCSSFDRRAKAKAEVFEALDLATQERLRAGQIELGDYPDMVFIALGRPDEKRESLTAEGRELIWIYFTYRQDYQGTRFVGYERHLVRSPTTGAVAVYYEPVHAPVYEQRAEERFRVVFSEGKVTAVESAR